MEKSKLDHPKIEKVRFDDLKIEKLKLEKQNIEKQKLDNIKPNKPKPDTPPGEKSTEKPPVTEAIIAIEDELLEVDLKNSREERRANGRMIALIIALSLIFLAIHHAWIKKSPVLAGALIPFVIMIVYGGWVVFLTKRDNRRRLLLERRMGEKLSEKGSEFGTQENLLKLQTKPVSNGSKPVSNGSKPSSQANSTPTEAKPQKKKRTNKSSEVVNPPAANTPAPTHKPNGRKKKNRHIPAEVISKLRQDRVPLCRTSSAP